MPMPSRPAMETPWMPGRPVLMTLLLAILLIAVAPASSAGLRIFACEPEWGALARELAPGADIYVASHAGQDPHYVEARPSLIAQLRQADLAICTGASLEAGWLPALQMRSANPAVQEGARGMFLAARQVSLIQEEHLHGDRRDGDVHPEGNPHLHLDPRRLASVGQALSRRMAELDPANAGDYQRRNIQFQVRWRSRIKGWEAAAQPLRGESLIVQHSSFIYLLDWLEIRTAADLEPKPGLPPTSGHLQALLEELADTQPLGILLTGYQNPRGARWLSEREGWTSLSLPSTVTDSAPADSLTGLYDHLLESLLALKAAQDG